MPSEKSSKKKSKGKGDGGKSPEEKHWEERTRVEVSQARKHYAERTRVEVSQARKTGEWRRSMSQSAQAAARQRRPGHETEVAVREFLKKHKEEKRAGTLTIDDVIGETGMKRTPAYNTLAWQAYLNEHPEKRRRPKGLAKPKKKPIALTDKMKRSPKMKIQVDAPDLAAQLDRKEEMARLIREQKAEEHEDGYAD